MSSVSGSERSQYSELMRELRDEYETKEARNAKRRAEEEKAMREKYKKELDENSRLNEERMSVLRDRNRDTINERDIDNQKKIEDLRKFYTDTLRRKTEEHEQMRDSQKTAFNGELENQKRIAEQQRLNQYKKLGDTIDEKNDLFARTIEENRVQAQEAVKQNSNRINETHENEKGEMRQGFYERLQSDKHLADEMKDSYRRDLKALQNAKDRESVRADERYRELVKEYEDDRMKALGRDVFQAERDQMRDRYQEAIERHRKNSEYAYDTLEEDLTQRVNNQVISKGVENDRLQREIEIERATHNKLRSMDRQNLQSAYEARLKDLERQKNETQEVFQDLSSKRMERVIDESQKLNRQAMRQAREKFNRYQVQAETDREIKTAEHKDLLQHVTDQAERRVEAIREQGDSTQVASERYFQDSLDQMKDAYSKKLDELRSQTAKQLASVQLDMTEKLRGIQDKWVNRLDESTKSYEAKLKLQEENHDREMKFLKRQFEVRLEEQGKGAEGAKLAIEEKYERKIEELNASHRDQIERLNDRNDENLQNVAVRYNRQLKKG